MKFHLEPVNHDKISDLCGPANSILKQIEEELGIKILNRGASFRIKGETLSAQIAKSIILKFYDDLDENVLQIMISSDLISNQNTNNCTDNNTTRTDTVLSSSSASLLPSLLIRLLSSTHYTSYTIIIVNNIIYLIITNCFS